MAKGKEWQKGAAKESGFAGKERIIWVSGCGVFFGVEAVGLLSGGRLDGMGYFVGLAILSNKWRNLWVVVCEWRRIRWGFWVGHRLEKLGMRDGEVWNGELNAAFVYSSEEMRERKGICGR